MLINYEASDSVVMDQLSMLNPRRVPSGSSVSSLTRPSTCASPERASSAANRYRGPACRVYKNMQRQLYKIWYDQVMPPAKALAYLRGRDTNDVVFTISGHPVQLSSTSVGTQQSRNTETAESLRNSISDSQLNGTRSLNGDQNLSHPIAKSPFRDSSKKNLLSPAIIGGVSKEHYSRRLPNNASHHEQALNASNGLYVSAHSLNTSRCPAVYSNPNGDRLQPVTSSNIVENPLVKGDVDEVDGSGSLKSFNHEKNYQRCNLLTNDKDVTVGNELDLISDGAIIISNAIPHSKNHGNENTHLRVSTASIASLNRRNRPFSSMTSSSSKNCGKNPSDDHSSEYPDPYPGGPPHFQQRLLDIAALENETLRWERLKASRRKNKTYGRQD